jgi:5-methylcytosine-specific restriction protein B
MPERVFDIAQALANYDRARDQDFIQGAERERHELLQRFPLDAWPTMPLERYALGQDGSQDTFCRWMEFGARKLGGIGGGSSRKHIIYKRKGASGWYFPSRYRDEREAWEHVRAGYVDAFQKAQAGDWTAIDDIEALRPGPALRLKALHLYFPADILAIYSKPHLKHFLGLLGRPESTQQTDDVVRLNRALLGALRETPELREWSTVELMRLLYSAADPKEARRIVKIAPGEGARYWPDCLEGGYICVGWDDIGDLREFESKDAFLARFEECYRDHYKNHGPTIRKKANEVWTLGELEPGDLVVANQGTSKILAVGEVVEPGYEWQPERIEYRHTVRVQWNTTYAKSIEPQKGWAVVTVAKVPTALYRQIVGDPAPTPVRLPVPRVFVDAKFEEIADALERKGQAILYGPPGTGKTYVARRFAVWWLLRDEDPKQVMVALADPTRLVQLESSLTATRATRHVWWVVANPKEWSWDRLFQEKKVRYRYGRLERNYPQVQPDDLVIGYQATPDKRVVALARVTEGLSVHAGDQRGIELAPLAAVKNGLTYEELAADPVLRVSEPMRHRNQGTLFSLTPEEADHALSLLTERNPELGSLLDGPAAGSKAVGALTLLTFHPSYTYEDFIEGFRPVDTGNNTLTLRLEDGVFKRICQEAHANPTKRYLLLIDEINRANIAKVFGELITLLEPDKRGVRVVLPQSRQNFTIPPNVYLLGTMNTADRSIKLLDVALRRRFAFVEMLPDVDLLRGAKVRDLALDDFLEELNRRIAHRQGREKQIGHSFLLDREQPVTDPDEFVRRLRQEILPLLQEYCYDDYSALAEYLGPRLVDAQAQTLNEDLLADTEGLLRALEEEFRGREESAT